MKLIRALMLQLCVWCILLAGFGSDAVFCDEFTARSAVSENVRDNASAGPAGGDEKPKAKRTPCKCFKCGGKGTVTIAVREDCDRCDGTGIAVTEVMLKDTEYVSDGWWGTRSKKTTRKAQNRQPCPRCDHRGKISVKKEVECSMCKGKGEL